MNSFHKAAVERRRLFVDYSCWLNEGVKLNAFQVQISPLTESPLSVSLAYTDVSQTKLAMMVAGGMGNTSYMVQLIAQTDAGQIKRNDIGFRVTP